MNTMLANLKDTSPYLHIHSEATAADPEYLQIRFEGKEPVAHHLLHLTRRIYSSLVAFPEFMDTDYLLDPDTREADPVTRADFYERMPAEGMGFYTIDASYYMGNEAYPTEIGAIRPTGICGLARADMYERDQLFTALQPKGINNFLTEYVQRGMQVPVLWGIETPHPRDIDLVREGYKPDYVRQFCIHEDLSELVHQ